MSETGKRVQAGGLVGIGLLLTVVPLFDMYEDVFVAGKAPLTTVAENTPLLVLTLGVVAAGVWLARADVDPEYVDAVTRWTVGNFLFVLVLFGVILGIQWFIQNDLKPLVIAADAVVVGTLGGFLLGIQSARRERAERSRFQALFDNLPNPVVGVEVDEGVAVVRQVNEPFVEVFGYARDEIVDQPLDRFVVPPDEEVDPLGDPLHPEGVDADLWSRDTVRLETITGRREFIRLTAPVDELPPGKRAYGIFIDITEEKTRRERLQVLGRILRHDIRNKLGIVLGEAAGVDGDAGEQITHAAEELLSISEKTREVERLVADEDGTSRVDLASAAAEAVANVEAAHGCEVAVEVPDAAHASGAETLVLAIEELVENAVVHNDSPSPGVAVTVAGSLDGEYYDIRVADDGPGIEPSEYRIVVGERERTQVDHPTGIGLWVANWVARVSGGDLRFEANAPEGTVAVLRVPQWSGGD